MAPGSICGELGAIIMVCGAPGAQPAGGAQRSPRLNQPPVIERHVLHPARLADNTISVTTPMSFFMFSFESRDSQVAVASEQL
jgi:hypothetical protein